MAVCGQLALVLAIEAIAAIAVASPAQPQPDAPLPTAASPSIPPTGPEPIVRPPDDTVRPPDVAPNSVDALGLMSIRAATNAAVDLDVERETGGDAFALIAGGRLGLPAHAFVDVALPVAVPVAALGDGRTAALGNAMFGIGVLPAIDRIAGVELRVALPTSRHDTDGLIAVAAPRLADPELFMPRATSAELVADWRWSGAMTWLQAEAGVAAWWPITGYVTVLRATLAGGVHATGWLDVTASFVTRSFVLASDSPNDFEHAALVGVVAHRDGVDVALRLEIPIEAGGYIIGLAVRGP